MAAVLGLSLHLIISITNESNYHYRGSQIEKQINDAKRNEKNINDSRLRGSKDLKANEHLSLPGQQSSPEKRRLL